MLTRFRAWGSRLIERVTRCVLDLKHYALLTVLSALLFGCGSDGNPDVYHIGQHRWVGDSIVVHLYRTSDSLDRFSSRKLTIECKSCNLVEDPIVTRTDNEQNAHIYIPETAQEISARLHVHGGGIDTTFIQKQRSPEEAMSFYNLSRPLIGRVMVNNLAVLYRDTTQDSVMAVSLVGDELNIFATHNSFYEVHHPNFQAPLFLLKENAVRLY